MASRRLWVTFGAVAAIAVGSAAACLTLSAAERQAAPAAEAPIRPVRIDTVHLAPAGEAVRYAAVIRPRIETDMGFRVPGKIAERLVDMGARVEAGTPLARLDPADLELQVRATEAQLASARAEATRAREDFERYRQLRSGDWATRQEFDKRKAAMETSEAKVRELEAQLRVARNNAQYATLKADHAGVVTQIMAEPGQVVPAGQPVARVARTGEKEAVAAVPESKVGALKDATLAVELWSMPGVAIHGTLREVAPSADPATRTYQVRIALRDPPPGIELGMTATLVAAWAQPGEIAVLPLAALTQNAGEPAVWVLPQGADKVERRPVTLGAYARDRVVVTAGLAEGEQVVTAGVHKLDATQRVRPWTEPLR